MDELTYEERIEEAMARSRWYAMERGTLDAPVDWHSDPFFGSDEKKYLNQLIYLRDNNIPFVEKGNRTLLINDEYYYWPSSGKWRVKGKTTVYKSRNTKDFVERFYNKYK